MMKDASQNSNIKTMEEVKETKKFNQESYQSTLGYYS
jgi:hypothetical protein